MPNAYRVYLKCPACKGTGKQLLSQGVDPPVNSEVDCPQCDGTKMELYGWLTEALASDMPDEPEPPAGGGSLLKSSPPTGAKRITNLYVNDAGKTVVEYDDTPV